MDVRSAAVPDEVIELARRVVTQSNRSDWESILAHSIETFALLSSWKHPRPICLAGLLLWIPSVAKGSASNELTVDAMGSECAQIVNRVIAKLGWIADASFHDFPKFLETSDSDFSDIVAARVLVAAAHTPGWAKEAVNRILETISPALSSEAYLYYLSSNLAIGLPEKAHELALEHFRKRLTMSLPDTSPCPHGHVTQVFPEKYYATILQLLPSHDAYHPIPRADSYTSACRRKLGVEGNRFHLWLADFLNAPSSGREFQRDLQKTFWRGFGRGFLEADFTNALANHLAVEEPVASPHVAIRLVREVGTAYVPPHVDMAHKYLTVIYYLCSSTPDVPGTSLYDASPDVNMRLRKTIPFVPNTALVLPRPNRSWHGVEPHLIHGSRTTLHLYLQEGSSGRTLSPEA